MIINTPHKKEHKPDEAAEVLGFNIVEAMAYFMKGAELLLDRGRGELGTLGELGELWCDYDSRSARWYVSGYHVSTYEREEGFSIPGYPNLKLKTS